MPPSREFKIEIDPQAQAELESALGILPYRVKVIRERNNVLYGRHHRDARLITLHTGSDTFLYSSLRAVKTEILNTLLHEFRHAFQHANWTAERIEADKRRPYQLQEMEEDANKWAAENVSKWQHLFRIRPITGNNLARIGRAERQVTHR